MRESAVIKTTARILLPFIVAFGLYLILSGADSVGGGFQGGAVLASAFIVHWIIHPEIRVRLTYLRLAERLLFIGLFALGILLLARSMDMPDRWGRLWVTAINLIIGIKVCCGLTIIFYRFIFFESR